MMVGRLLSFWEGLFSGAMLNFRGVLQTFGGMLQKSTSVAHVYEQKFCLSWTGCTFAGVIKSPFFRVIKQCESIFEHPPKPPTFWNSYTRTLILDTIMKLSGTIGVTQKTMTLDTHVRLILLQTLKPQERWGTHKNDDHFSHIFSRM